LIAKRDSDNIHIQGNETVNDFFTKRNDVADTTGAAMSAENEGDVNNTLIDQKLEGKNEKFTVQ
jgi:hypothetical protein